MGDHAQTPQASRAPDDDAFTDDASFEAFDSFDAELAAMIDAQPAHAAAPSVGAGASLEEGCIVDDRYEIGEVLGRGGFGVVYAARQRSTGQRVAIKVMTADLNADPARVQTAIARFQRETKLIAQLRHPNIVRLIDTGQLPDARRYSVLEFVDGAPLSEVLRSEGGLEVGEAKQLMLQVLDALACAHDLGVVHRDLKPHNIMICATGVRRQAVVLDFGISAIAGGFRDPEYETLTREHGVCGTPSYMAPEQLRDSTVTVQSDIYAWGLVFVECLTGEPVFAGASGPAIIHAQMSDAPVVLPPVLQGTELGDVLMAAVAKPLSERYTDARALYRDLVGCAPVPAVADTSASSAPGASTRTGEPASVGGSGAPGPRVGLGVGVAVAVLALVGLGVAWLASQRPDPAAATPAASPARQDPREAARAQAPPSEAPRQEQAAAGARWAFVEVPADVAVIGLPEDRLERLRERYAHNEVDLYRGTGVLPFDPAWKRPALRVMRDEVTWGDWQARADAQPTGVCAGAWEVGDPGRAVAGVGAAEAEAFCKASGLRLPTAREWEALARGAEGRLFGVSAGAGAALTPAQLQALGQPSGVPDWSRTPEGIRALTGGVSEWVTCASDELEYCVDGYAHRGGSWRYGERSKRPEPALLLAPLVGVLGASPRCLRRDDIGFRCVGDVGGAR